MVPLFVSILVMLDIGLKDFFLKSIDKAEKSFNPCYVGYRSERIC